MEDAQSPGGFMTNALSPLFNMGDTKLDLNEHDLKLNPTQQPPDGGAGPELMGDDGHQGMGDPVPDEPEAATNQRGGAAALPVPSLSLSFATQLSASKAEDNEAGASPRGGSSGGRRSGGRDRVQHYSPYPVANSPRSHDGGRSPRGGQSPRSSASPRAHLQLSPRDSASPRSSGNSSSMGSFGSSGPPRHRRSHSDDRSRTMKLSPRMNTGPSRVGADLSSAGMSLGGVRGGSSGGDGLTGHVRRQNASSQQRHSRHGSNHSNSSQDELKGRFGYMHIDSNGHDLPHNEFVAPKSPRSTDSFHDALGTTYGMEQVRINSVKLEGPDGGSIPVPSTRPSHARHRRSHSDSSSMKIFPSAEGFRLIIPPQTLKSLRDIDAKDQSVTVLLAPEPHSSPHSSDGVPLRGFRNVSPIDSLQTKTSTRPKHYKCSKCGQLKKGHVCEYATEKPPRAPKGVSPRERSNSNFSPQGGNVNVMMMQARDQRDHPNQIKQEYYEESEDQFGSDGLELGMMPSLSMPPGHQRGDGRNLQGSERQSPSIPPHDDSGDADQASRSPGSSQSREMHMNDSGEQDRVPRSHHLSREDMVNRQPHDGMADGPIYAGMNQMPMRNHDGSSRSPSQHEEKLNGPSSHQQNGGRNQDPDGQQRRRPDGYEAAPGGLMPNHLEQQHVSGAPGQMMQNGMAEGGEGEDMQGQMEMNPMHPMDNQVDMAGPGGQGRGVQYVAQMNNEGLQMGNVMQQQEGMEMHTQSGQRMVMHFEPSDPHMLNRSSKQAPRGAPQGGAPPLFETEQMRPHGDMGEQQMYGYYGDQRGDGPMKQEPME